ncbi:MAG: hypothetical protein ACM31C_12335 [Acidobacteriota bacterium]
MAAEEGVVIASRAGLVVLAVLALALAVAVALGSGGHRGVDRRLAPGVDVDQLTEIDVGGAWQGKLTRGEHGWLRDGAPIAPDAIDALLAAVRGGHWHRRADRAIAGTPRATVTLVAGIHRVELAVGGALEGSGQTWLVRGDDALLVDDWIAHALAPGELELADRHPLAGLAGASRVAIGERVELAGHHMDRPLPMWIAPALVDALDAAATQIELVAPAPHVVLRGHAPPKLAWGDDWADDAGPCDAAGARVVVVTSRGEGCVEAARWHAVLAAIAAFDRPPGALLDPHPLAAAPLHLVLADGAKLDRDKRPQVDGKDADPDRVDELVAALTQPAQVVAVPTTPPTATITADAITLDVYGRDKVLARRGEPFALRPKKDAWETITRPGSGYADSTRWLEEPTTISTITIDGKRHQRGATLGAWTAARDPALLEALATALGTVRAPDGPNPARIRHRIQLTITAPTGTSSHTVELGDHCAALVDHAPVVLPLATCTAVTAAL